MKTANGTATVPKVFPNCPCFVGFYLAMYSLMRYNSNVGLIGDVVEANNCEEKS